MKATVIKFLKCQKILKVTCRRYFGKITINVYRKFMTRLFLTIVLLIGGKNFDALSGPVSLAEIDIALYCHLVGGFG